MEEARRLCDEILVLNKGTNCLLGNPIQILQDKIEPYVCEIYQYKQSPLDKSLRQILIGETTYIYANSLKKLNDLEKSFESGRTFIRKSNLEDVFIKLTGASLEN